MKRLAQITIILLVVSLLTTTFAFPYKITKNHPKYKAIEVNLLKGLESDNIGLKSSSAYMLGEMQSEDAVIALTKILRSDTDERVRLMSALSLIKIGTERSVYVVKNNVKFEENQRVARMCDKFYKAYLFNKENRDNVKKQIRYAMLLN